MLEQKKEGLLFMIDVVYQYINGPAAWNELRYSLRSLEKHLKEPFKVWVVGEKPGWLTNVNHISHQRVPGVHFTNSFDANSKMELAINHPKIGDNILWMYDDMYLLRDCVLRDFDVYLAVNHYDDLNHSSSNTHKEIVIDTLKILLEHNRSAYNCETHTPRLYNKTILQDVFKKYNPKDVRLAASTLYFNDLFYELQPHIMQKADKYKAGFYGFDDPYSFISNNVEEITEILSGKTFLNHNNEGLSVALKSVVEQRFPDKCSFEK
jgi:hypothetical protein